MADSMQFDLVTPERRLASAKVGEVMIPGAEGDLTAMPGHAAVIMTLRPGILRAGSGTDAAEFVVSSGFVEITAEAVSVMAEEAFDRKTVRREQVEAILEKARKAAEEAPADKKDLGEKIVADLVHLLEMME